ncbi:MAG: hypothetical protein DMF71_10240 [Acidobacteria bacterium]|nr:MAG: hypothetical protein DMF71_10240 [Acidobacteriota bacterium]
MKEFRQSILFCRRTLLTASALSLILLACAQLVAAPCSQIKAQPEPWVRVSVNLLVRTAHGFYLSDVGQQAYERAVDNTASTLRRCQLEHDEAFGARYREFVDYLGLLSLARLPDHELGFTVPDKQYFEETRQYVEIPDFLLTPEFLREVSRFETLNQAKALLRKINETRSRDHQLIFFSYRSRHLGTPDNDDSFLRLLIVVPGNAAQRLPEKWVQFGVPDPRARAPVRNVSVVSALAAPDGTTNVYFKDNFRTYHRDGSITIKGRWELGEGDDNCATCHKSGILPIFPVAGSVSRDEKQFVDVVNERFLKYVVRPRFDKYLDATKLGPGIGSTADETIHRRFGSAFANTTVGKSMICSSCHKPDGLGSLNWPMDRVVISSYIKGGQMPFGSELRPLERAELYRKLIQDYFDTDEANPGVLKSWLLGRLRQRKLDEPAAASTH